MKRYNLNYFILSVLLISSITISSCSKNFLTEPKPVSGLSEKDVYASDQGVRAYFNGIYSYMRTQYGGAGEVGGSTDAWGITSVELARVVKGLDVVLDGGWYNFDYEIDNREATYRRTVFVWRFYYELANQANNMIVGIANSTALSEESKKAFTAEAKAFRAYCHFEVSLEYSHAYLENPDAKGIPYYTVPTDATTTGEPRGTLKETYTAILKDLNEALPDIPEDRQMKDVINKDVVEGLLARVYLQMGDYENAAKYAKAAQANYSLDYDPPITDIDKSDVIWGFPQSSDQTIYYGVPSSFWGGQGNGYDNFYIDTNFVHKFSATDVRSKDFYSTESKDFDLFRYKTAKFGNDINFTDHIIVMRSSEMLLIEAEAKARLNDNTADDVLYKLQLERDPDAVKSNNTGAALIAEILLERRKELYGEIGVSFLDIKRTQSNYSRDAGHPAPYNLQIPANSNKFTLKIPQTEMDGNKSFTAADQND